MDFSTAIVNGIPLVLVVIGLVELLKKFGVSGNWLVGASVLFGICFGISYQLSIAIPVDFAGWFAAGVYGIGLGLVASGAYDAAKSVLSR